jgi:hypothetical protein
MCGDPPAAYKGVCGQRGYADAAGQSTRSSKRGSTMGGFIDSTVNSTEPGSASEVRCGQVLAGLVPTKWVVVLVNPSGHRSAIGGSGATADFIVFNGGNGKSFEDLQMDETKWGTIDAYTPEANNDGNAAADKVWDKLDTQARAVIVDLANLTNEANRKRVVNRVEAKVGKKKDKMVIFTYNGANTAINTMPSFTIA